MDKIAEMTSTQRAELITQTAEKKPFLSQAAIEKDFWVCFMLDYLFHEQAHVPYVGCI